MTTRYALYFAPANDSQLASFGEYILGRTAESISIPGFETTFSDKLRWQKLTRSPRHYGFHATLKAPFELACDTTCEQLLEDVAHFSKSCKAITLTDLAPRRIADFAALTLVRQPGTLVAFAQRCVEAFEPYRAPITQQDLARRQQVPLSDRQLDLLNHFGYPYVAEEFRFHMTLSGKLQSADDDYLNWLVQVYQRSVNSIVQLDSIAVFAQQNRQQAFTRLAEFPFSADDKPQG